MSEKTEYKIRLHQYCIALIEQRIANAWSAMDNAQAAANNEEKSSAGDKYETGRAMGHLEKEMHGKQLAANRKELAALLGINCNILYNTVSVGSFIKCDNSSFFISAGLGKVNFEGETVFVLSPIAPIATKLFGKKAGDSFEFNNKSVTIKDVY